MKNQPVQTHPVLILPNIRSAQNVGSLFRTADAIGIEHVYIVGYTPTPIDRFDRPRSDIAKTALGSEQTISWSYHKTFASTIKLLKTLGYTIVLIEQDIKAIDYKKYKPKRGEKLAFVVGNEVTGLTKKEKSHADVILEISMRGRKESLNVTIAAGIVLFRILDK